MSVSPLNGKIQSISRDQSPKRWREKCIYWTETLPFGLPKNTLLQWYVKWLFSSISKHSLSTGKWNYLYIQFITVEVFTCSITKKTRFSSQTYTTIIAHSNLPLLSARTIAKSSSFRTVRQSQAAFSTRFLFLREQSDQSRFPATKNLQKYIIVRNENTKSFVKSLWSVRSRPLNVCEYVQLNANYYPGTALI